MMIILNEDNKNTEAFIVDSLKKNLYGKDFVMDTFYRRMLCNYLLIFLMLFSNEIQRTCLQCFENQLRKSTSCEYMNICKIDCSKIFSNGFHSENTFQTFYHKYRDSFHDGLHGCRVNVNSYR